MATGFYAGTRGSAGALEVAELAEADAVDVGPLQRDGQLGVAGDEVVVVDPTGPVGGEGAQLGGVERRVDVHLGDAGSELADRPLDRAAATDAVPHEHEVVGEQHA